MAFHSCQAACELLQHVEASTTPTLLKSWPPQHLRRFLHTRGVIVPVEDHLNLRDVLLGVGVPDTGDVLKNRPDHCLADFL